MPKVSYIVSAYSRPHLLPLVLLSLKTQSDPDIELIVADNSISATVAKRHREIALDLGAKYIRTAKKTPINDPYWAAEWVLEQGVKGDWLGFPCDDCYYVPTFQQKMLDHAARFHADLVCCDVLYRFNSGQHGVVRVDPMRALCAKSSFLVKCDRFTGFRQKPRVHAGPSAGDATAVLDLCEAGVPWAVVPEVLVVHN